MKCLVNNCTNKTEEGMFIGNICAPCFDYLVRGEGDNSQAKRNNEKENKIILPIYFDSYEKYQRMIATGSGTNENSNIIYDLFLNKKTYAFKKLQYIVKRLNDDENEAEIDDDTTVFILRTNGSIIKEKLGYTNVVDVIFYSRKTVDKAVELMGKTDINYLRGKYEKD